MLNSQTGSLDQKTIIVDDSVCESDNDNQAQQSASSDSGIDVAFILTTCQLFQYLQTRPCSQERMYAQEIEAVIEQIT